MKNPTVNIAKTAASEKVVKIVNGAGNPAQTYPYQDGDTVQTVMKRAGIVLEHGTTATLGRRRIKNPVKTTVRPGDTIVIAQKVNNGHS